MRPIRFGSQVHNLPHENWKERVELIEKQGYSSILFSDHWDWVPYQWETVSAITAAAIASKTLQVGSLVYCNDYRHPVTQAQSSLTIQLISKGRHEFGIGAGWMKREYHQAGIKFDAHKTRIQRLDEALDIIKSIWRNEETSYTGKFYSISKLKRTINLGEISPPKLLVGGGGPMMLRVAGKHGDIVNMLPRISEGDFTSNTMKDGSFDRYEKKVEWITKSVTSNGREMDDVELSVGIFHAEITDDRLGVERSQAEQWSVSVDLIHESPCFLIGSCEEIREKIVHIWDSLGISYFVMDGETPESTALLAKQIIQPLTR